MRAPSTLAKVYRGHTAYDNLHTKDVLLLMYLPLGDLVFARFENLACALATLVPLCSCVVMTCYAIAKQGSSAPHRVERHSDSLIDVGPQAS